jgi:hypothetical protein
VYSRIISVDNNEVFRFAEQFSLFDELPLLRGQRNSELVAFVAHNGSRFQQYKPIPRLRVISMNWNEVSPSVENAHKTNLPIKCRSNSLIAALVPDK